MEDKMTSKKANVRQNSPTDMPNSRIFCFILLRMRREKLIVYDVTKVGHGTAPLLHVCCRRILLRCAPQRERAPRHPHARHRLQQLLRMRQVPVVLRVAPVPMCRPAVLQRNDSPVCADRRHVCWRHAEMSASLPVVRGSPASRQAVNGQW